MATWVIVRKSDLEVLSSYVADAKDDTSANRSHLHAEPLAAHLELPEGVEADICRCDMVEDEMILSNDAAKEAAREEERWARMREARDWKLKESDRYVLSDYPISPEDLDLVKAYRQELRDLPENTVDPLNPEWPEFPELS